MTHVRTTEMMAVTKDQANLFYADFQTFYGLSSHHKDKMSQKKGKKAMCYKCKEFS